MKTVRKILIGAAASAAMVISAMTAQTTVITPPKAHADLLECATESGAEAYWDDLWGDCD